MQGGFDASAQTVANALEASVCKCCRIGRPVAAAQVPPLSSDCTTRGLSLGIDMLSVAFLYVDRNRSGLVGPAERQLTSASQAFAGTVNHGPGHCGPPFAIRRNRIKSANGRRSPVKQYHISQPQCR